MRTFLLLITLSALPLAASADGPTDWRSAKPSDWQVIFNGRNLDGWVVKFAHHEVGDNYADTFRVENGAIRVMYDKYGDDFGARFGHLFYKEKLSYYVLALEYRFFGEQVKGGPSYARLNSGVMMHSQAPESILKDQDWPISVEAQFLAGNRTTMNVCTPGTEIFMNGDDGQGALHQLLVAQIRRRRLDRGGSRSARRRVDPPPDRRQDGARIREADDRRRRRERLGPGDQEGRHAPRPRATSACRPRASRSSSATSACCDLSGCMKP